MEKLLWTTEKRTVDSLVPYTLNPRKISSSQKEILKRSLERFGLVELPVVNRDNTIVAGHQRLAILKLIGRGAEEIDVRVPSRQMTTEEFDEYLLTSNRNSGEWDWKLLNEFDKDLLLKVGFDTSDIKKIMGANDPRADARLKLMDRFIVPPFSVIDTRSGYWQDRKRAWLALTGNLAESKENVLWKSASGADANYYQQKTSIEKFLGREISNEEYEEKFYEPDFINSGSSAFDPVLAEVVYTWFNVKGGRILDPFAGEQTKAVVAGELKMGYTGIDIREEQIAIDKEACKDYKNHLFFAGDSNKISELVPDDGYDLIFTSPPYYDLEVYSKDDMSALGTYEEFMAQYKNIFSQCVEKLADKRFLVVKIGEIRDKKTGVYRNFIADNIKIFEDLGLKYYNEMILINTIGTLPIRAPKQFNQSRKIGKVHQNVLAFFKGPAEDLFKESHAVYSTHQNLLAFFKGELGDVQKEFGEVSRVEDIITSL